MDPALLNNMPRAFSYVFFAAPGTLCPVLCLEKTQKEAHGVGRLF